jgi:hypothetical protein
MGEEKRKSRAAREKAARAARERRKAADARLGRRASWAGIASAVLAAAALLIAYLTLIKDDDPVPAAAPRSPRLERVDLIARNTNLVQESGLDLLVRNGGGSSSVISRAHLEIRHVYRFPLCFTQGNLAVSERYGIQLPADAEAGEVTEVPLHQQVEAGKGDRFRLALEVAAEEEAGLAQAIYIFEIAVSLVHDGERVPLRMGAGLVALPVVPTSEFLLEEGGFESAVEAFGSAGRPVREFWSRPLACWRKNGRTAARLRRSSATRSPELEEVLASAVVPSFAEIEG